MQRNLRPCARPSAPIRSARHNCGTPPAAPKNQIIPSNVCSRSTDVVNHHSRHRDQHKNIPKHHNTGPSPTRCDHPEQSEKSTGPSSTAPYRSARWLRRLCGTSVRVAHEPIERPSDTNPLNPSAQTISNNDVATILFPTNDDDNRSAHTGSTRRPVPAVVRAGGGHPSRHHFEIIAG